MVYMHTLTYIFLALSVPFAVSAQGLTTMASSTLGFIDSTVIPFLLGIGFLFFLINVIRYFVFGSTDEDGREKAKNLAIYSVAAFVLIVVFWGIVNLIAGSIGLSGVAQPTADYIDPDGVKKTGIPDVPENLLPRPGVSNPNLVGCTTTTTGGNTSFAVMTVAECNTIGGTISPNNTGGNGGANTGTVEEEQDTWLGGIIRTFPRPWRDYFWANWGSNDSGGNDSDPRIPCLLPNGQIEELRESICFDLNGEEYTGQTTTSTGNTQTSFELTSCSFVDPTTGQTRIIQATAEACADFNNENSF